MATGPFDDGRQSAGRKPEDEDRKEGGSHDDDGELTAGRRPGEEDLMQHIGAGDDERYVDDGNDDDDSARIQQQDREDADGYATDSHEQCSDRDEVEEEDEGRREGEGPPDRSPDAQPQETIHRSTRPTTTTETSRNNTAPPRQPAPAKSAGTWLDEKDAGRDTSEQREHHNQEE